MTASPSHFRALHRPGAPLLMPNPWDVGSALILKALGFTALATTSSGFAATLGRPDGAVTREQAIEHAVAIATATGLPVNADLENGFAAAPEDVAVTAALAAAAGLAGFSIEDATGRTEEPVHPIGLAAERVRAAAEAAHAGPEPLVLTARAENYLYDRADLADTIARLQAYQEAGADVLYAPGLHLPEDIRAVVASVDRPVNVLAIANVPAIPLLAEMGVARVSVGGAFAFAALGALKQAAEELRGNGTYGYLAQAKLGSSAARAAFPESRATGSHDVGRG